jgi:dynein heavy chain
MITFLDDLNMPEKEVYGAQPPLELIRQWIDYGYWYDRSNRMLKNVKNMVLIGAMGPPGGGRNTVSNRLTSCFSVINLTFPEESQISYIFNSMLNQHMKPFEEYMRNMSNGRKKTRSTFENTNANLIRRVRVDRDDDRAIQSRGGQPAADTGENALLVQLEGHIQSA